MTRTAALFLILLAAGVASAAEPIVLAARTYDEVRIRGIEDPIRGKIEKLDDQVLRFRKLNGEGREWPRDQVVSIRRRCTLLESYQFAAKAAGTDPEAHFRLHEACLKAGLKKEAFAELKEAILVDRKYTPAYEKMLATARAARNRDLELWALSAASDAGIATAPMLIRLAELYVLLGMIENAEAPLRNALRVDPGNTKAGARLAMLELTRGAPDRAEKHIRTMLESKPGDPFALVALGQLELARDRPQQAVAAFKRALAKTKSAEAATALAALYLRGGNLDEAEKYYELALSARRNFAPAVAGQALVYAATNRLDRAQAALRKIAAAGGPAIAATRGYVAERSGKHKAALTHYETAVAGDASNLHALAGAGRCLWALGERTKAIGRFRQALALDPAFAPALRGLGRVTLAWKPSESAKVHRQLVASGAATPADRAALAGALIRLQRFGEAAAELAKAGTDNVHARIGLGFLEYAQGKTDAALGHFNAAIRLGDYRRYAASAVRRIRLAESRVAWSDLFDRDDGPEPRNGWVEREPPGVSISIASKSLLIDGKPGGAKRLARLARHENRSFVALSAEAATGSESESFVGVFIARPGQAPAVLFGRDGSGKAVVIIPGTRPGRLINEVAPGKFTVGIGIIDWNRGRFGLMLNGRRPRGRRSYTVPALAGAEELEVGVFAQPAAGKTVNCRFHSVKIVRTK